MEPFYHSKLDYTKQPISHSALLLSKSAAVSACGMLLLSPIAGGVILVSPITSILFGVATAVISGIFRLAMTLLLQPEHASHIDAGCLVVTLASLPLLLPALGFSLSVIQTLALSCLYSIMSSASGLLYHLLDRKARLP